MFSLFPINVKLFLSTSSTKPIKAHVHSFGSVLYNFFGDVAVGNNVVKLNWCWTLDVSHFMWIISKVHSSFSVDKT